MHGNAINFLYNPGHLTHWCLEVVPVVYAWVVTTIANVNEIPMIIIIVAYS